MRYFLTLGLIAISLTVLAALSGCGGSTSAALTTTDTYQMALIKLNTTTTQWEVAPINGLKVGDKVDLQIDKISRTRAGVDYFSSAIRPDGTEAPFSKTGWTLDQKGKWIFKANGSGFSLQIESTVTEAAPKYTVTLQGAADGYYDNYLQKYIEPSFTNLEKETIDNVIWPAGEVGQRFAPRLVVNGTLTRTESATDSPLWIVRSVELLQQNGQPTNAYYQIFNFQVGDERTMSVQIHSIGRYMIRTTVELRSGEVKTFENHCAVEPYGTFGLGMQK